MKQSEFEDKVVELLLKGDSDLIAKLREQYKNAEVTQRTFTGRGFITEYKVPTVFKYGNVSEIGPAIIVYSNPLDTGMIDIHFKNGLLDWLEGTAIVGDWRQDYENGTLELADGYSITLSIRP